MDRHARRAPRARVDLQRARRHGRHRRGRRPAPRGPHQVALAVSVLACKMESWDAPGVAVDLARYFSRPPDAAPPPSSPSSRPARRRRRPPDASGAAGPAGPVQVHVQLTPDGAAVVSVAGIVALLQIFAVLPRSARPRTSPSIPRAAAVSLGLRAAASSVVYPTLETLVHNPNVHADPHARALLMRALAAWSSFEPAAAAACPSSALAAAVSAITVDARASHPAVADAAAAATTAAATAAVHRPERREALGATLAALREHCAGAGAGGGGGGDGDGNGRGGEDADDDDAESRRARRRCSRAWRRARRSLRRRRRLRRRTRSPSGRTPRAIGRTFRTASLRR